MTVVGDHEIQSPVSSKLTASTPNDDDNDNSDTSCSTTSRDNDIGGTEPRNSLWTGIQKYVNHSYGLQELKKQQSRRIMSHSQSVSIKQPKIQSNDALDVAAILAKLDKPIEGDIFERRRVLEDRLVQLKFISVHYRSRMDQFILSNKYTHNKRIQVMEHIGHAEEEKENRLLRLEVEKKQYSSSKKELSRMREEAAQDLLNLTEKRKQVEELRRLYKDTEAKNRQMISDRMEINLALKQSREHTLEIARTRVNSKIKYEDILEKHQNHRDLLKRRTELKSQIGSITNEVINFEKEILRLSKQNLQLKQKILQNKDAPKKDNVLQKIFAKRKNEVSSSDSSTKQTQHAE